MLPRSPNREVSWYNGPCREACPNFERRSRSFHHRSFHQSHHSLHSPELSLSLSHNNAQEVCDSHQAVSRFQWRLTHDCSGIARSLRASTLPAIRQPTRARALAQPIKKNLAPSLAARYASTDSAKQGKIHQVIGAVVDGMAKFLTAKYSASSALASTRPGMRS